MLSNPNPHLMQVFSAHFPVPHQYRSLHLAPGASSTAADRRQQDWGVTVPQTTLHLLLVFLLLHRLCLFFSFFFKCRKLDSFESVRTTFMVNTTFGNYSTRLKVTPHSQMFTERNTHGLSQTSVQSNNEKRIKVIGHEYNMTAMHKSSSLKVSKVTEKRWVEQKF